MRSATGHVRFTMPPGRECVWNGSRVRWRPLAGFFVMVNQKALDALPPESRKAVMDALPGYVAALRNGTHGGATNGRQWLVKEGMTAVSVSPADRATMEKAAATVVDNWVKRLKPDGRKLYDQAKAMIDEYKAKKN
jgi:TRAP-type C4-dicarboxylate transport system substrate-binding protein